MNNLYNWHDEQMVRLEMQEIDRELQQARLLKEAGLSDTDWMVRVVSGVRNALIAGRNGLRDHSLTVRKWLRSERDKLFE